MTKQEKQAIMDQKTIAYWTDFNGVEVKSIEYGIEDYLYCVSLVGSAEPKVHYLKIKTSRGGRPYVILYGRPMYLDECLRV